MTSPDIRVGDRVLLDDEPCVHWPFHAHQPLCARPGQTGVVDELSPSNGGVENGHGIFVRLDCEHDHRVPASRAELRRL